jgi:four helix bundle protein
MKRLQKDFRDSPLWQQSMALAVEIHDHTIHLGKEYLYGLVSQIRSSSNAISGHIAEAHGRQVVAEKINFYHYARASVYETISHLEYCKNVELIKNEAFLVLNRNCKSLVSEISRNIDRLRDKQTLRY